ncbi:MAG: glycosylase [Kiritimatiellae bacterium]|nr:glycosylase [Kiritimatiellia bacterium]
MKANIGLVAIAAAAAMTAPAKVELATPFKDRMVLQRGMEAPVWGWADAGEKVRTLSPISDSEMRAVYEEVKTPFKAGLALRPEEGEMLDNPMVFRHGDSWYMMFIRFDGKGYETHLAKSSDLLSWTRLGRIFSRGPKGAWDSSQADGWPTLLDSRWEGSNTLSKFDGRYWMMYLGGSADGYETDPLSTGVAWTDDPTSLREWTRYEGNPVMSPSDCDARDFERKTIYKHFTVEDGSRSLGGRFVNFYNAKQNGAWHEAIGMAVSDDMLHWRRVGDGPVVDNGTPDQECITGDPMVRRIGDKWVMFYFGLSWKDGVKGAFDTFACSRDFRTWKKWDGEPLVRPSEAFDSEHAHKPWVIKHDGVVYHWYCAVSPGMRGIALATSRPINSLKKAD